jgi:hypothetical protein
MRAVAAGVRVPTVISSSVKNSQAVEWIHEFGEKRRCNLQGLEIESAVFCNFFGHENARPLSLRGLQRQSDSVPGSVPYRSENMMLPDLIGAAAEYFTDDYFACMTQTEPVPQICTGR